MGKMLLVFCFAWSFTSATARAADQGFRYSNGKCVNASGKAGMNPGFTGQCGDQRNVDLSGKSLANTDLSGSVFDGSDLQNTDFKMSVLNGASFAASKLSGALFELAKAQAAVFKGAVLSNVHFNGAELKNCDFSGTDLSGVLLSYMDLSGSKFVGATFTGAAIDHSTLTAADLSGANMIGVNLQGSVLDQARLDKAQLGSANLISASLKNVTGENANFRSAVLREAKLTGAKLKGAAFRGAGLNEADLTKASFENADFRDAVLRAAIVEGTEFKGVIYNKRTILPFGADVAAGMGMVLMKPASLLIIRDLADDASVTDLQAFLTDSGVDVKLATQMADAFNGSEKLADYSAVLHLNGALYDKDMPMTGQTAIMNFVQAGGTYIATQWTGYSTETGLLKGLRDVIFMTDPDDANGALNLAPVSAQAGHAVLNGILGPLSIDSYFSQGGLFPFTSNPAVSLMKDDKGNDIVAVRTVGKGKAVNFAFANAYNRQSLGCFSQAAVQQLVLNAINW